MLAIYSKTAGKGGKHASIDTASNIAATSYISVQLFEHTFGNQFCLIPEKMVAFQTKQYTHLLSKAFLCLLDFPPIVPSNSAACDPGSAISTSLSKSDHLRFSSLFGVSTAISKVLIELGKRSKGKGKGKVIPEELSSGEDDD